jgi:SAM-dependent methyltransferase
MLDDVSHPAQHRGPATGRETSTWRGAVRDRLDDLDLVAAARTARHWVRSRGGASDRELIARHLADEPDPRLQLGCGTRPIPGWLNSDFSPRTLEAIRIDATKPLPFADDTFAHVYSEHMIEHLGHQDGERLLSEIRRVLRPGGRLRVSTPDLGRLLALFRPPEEWSDDERRYVELIIGRHVEGVDPAEVNPVYVLNNNVRDWGHRFLYDVPTFRSCLRRAGFEQLEQFELQASDDPVLRGLANESRMPPGLVAFETMTFEAVAP